MKPPQPLLRKEGPLDRTDPGPLPLRRGEGWGEGFYEENEHDTDT